MKLLYCINCTDIKALTVRGFVKCQCGDSRARYESAETSNCVVEGKGLILAIDNKDLKGALTRKTEGLNKSQKLSLFILPEPCSSVRRV